MNPVLARVPAAAAWLILSHGLAAHAEKEAGRSKVDAGSRDPSATSSVAQPGASLVLAASGKSKSGTARVGIELGDWGVEAKLSTPFGSDGAIDQANLDGLARKTTADVGATYLIWHPRADLAERADACRAYVPEWVAKKREKFECEAELLPSDGGFRKRYKAAEAARDDAAMQQVCSDYVAALDAAAGRAMSGVAPAKDTYPPGFVCAASQLDGEALRRFKRATDVGTPVLLSVRVKAGRDDFKFVDPMSFVQQPSEIRYSIAVTGSVGIYRTGLGYAALGARYERSFEGGPTGELCFPVGTMGVLQCKQLGIGGPTRTERIVGTLEWRRFLGPHFGVGPRISFDFTHSALGMELPIYFLQDEGRGFSGGIELEYVRDGDENSGQLTVFVGQTFEVL